VHKTSATERNKRYSKQRYGKDVGNRKERVRERAAWRARRQQEKEKYDTAGGTAGKRWIRECKERCSERHGGQDVGGRKKWDAVTGTAVKEQLSD
jgi:hypothetical protein